MTIRPRFVRASILFVALSPLLLVTACGQKGDLYPEASTEPASDERPFKGRTLEQKEKDLHQQQWDDATTRLRERD